MENYEQNALKIALISAAYKRDLAWLALEKSLEIKKGSVK